MIWYQSSGFQHMVVHSDSTSATAQTQYEGASPDQTQAKSIQRVIGQLLVQEGLSAETQWVKGQAGSPGNEKAYHLAGEGRRRLSDHLSFPSPPQNLNFRGI